MLPSAIQSSLFFDLAIAPVRKRKKTIIKKITNRKINIKEAKATSHQPVLASLAPMCLFYTKIYRTPVSC
jgi:hypothetical protein